MTTTEILRAARAKVQKGWCQGRLARNADGKGISPDDPDAVSWCAIGGIESNHKITEGQAWEAKRLFRRVVGLTGPGIDKWNDAPGRTQAEVLAAFDAAIELSRLEGVQTDA